MRASTKTDVKLTKAERESMASADRFDVFCARADVAIRLKNRGLATRHPRFKDLSVLTEAGRKALSGD